MGLSIHGLRVHLCILKCGSLSAAGRKLGMTQPAVSNHLHALEERFGVAMLTQLREMGKDGEFFSRTHCSGSHLNSMEMVAGGEVDAAIIDSNVLRIRLGSAPELRGRLRVIEIWGPFPIQPVVLRSGLHPELKNRLRATLLAIGEGAHAPPALAGFGLERFAPVTY